jgi:hypothetical protein
MNSEYEIGNSVRLKEPCNGWSAGEVTAFYGTKIEVTLTNGKEVEVYEDELEDL